jgi:glycosyltransferase involved in cell wall biosynthesis
MYSHSYILISAHHCAPGMGSEHATGWNLVSRLARIHPILLITQDNEFRSNVENGISELKNQGARIEVFFVRHGFTTDGRVNSLRLFYYLTYRFYQKRVLDLAKKLQKDYVIIAVHHLTIHGFREPGYLWSMGIPFVWGPVGFVYAPWVLFDSLPAKAKIFQFIRNFLTWIQFNFSSRVRSAYLATQSSGGAFVAANPDVGQRFVKKFGGSYIWIPETGSIPSIYKPAEFDKKGPLSLLWVGALVDRKPLDMLLNSITRIPDYKKRITLTIIGDGDARKRFERTASRLGIVATFEGWLPHKEAIAKFTYSELLVMFSVNDGTPNVIFEALSSGVPVMCLDHHGYSFIIDDSCGIKLKVENKAFIQRSIVFNLISLLDNRVQLNSMSCNALEKASRFSWDNNAHEISKIYRKISND